MLWKRNCPKIGFGIFSLVFVCVLLCSFFLDTTSVFAVSDYSGTLDYQHSSTGGVCNTGNPSSSLSGEKCSDYKYLLLSVSGDFNNDSSAYVSYNSINFKFINLADPTVLSISSNVALVLGNYSYIFNSNWSVHYTITNSYPANCPPSPSGSLSISHNGTFDVSSYAEAVVDVPAEVIPGDYHNDLVSIYNAILICAATCLVIYFFFCIYRMIIKSTGGK